MKKYILIYLLIFGLAFYLRWLQVKDNLYFGYEQGRDAFQAMDIWQGKDLALVGPKTDIDGIFHSPLFYYLLAPLYGLGHANPWGVVITLLLVNAGIPILAGRCVNLITKNRWSGVITALLAAVSMECVSYGAWLSNVPLSLPFSLLAVISFSSYLKQPLLKPWLMGIFWALLSAQFEIILLMEWGFFILVITALGRHISFKGWVIAAGMGLLSVSWLFLFNLRHQWMMIPAIQKYSTGAHPAALEGVRKFVEISTTIIERTTGLPALLVCLLLAIGMWLAIKRGYRREIYLLVMFILMSLPTLLFPESVKLDQLHVNLGIGILMLIGFLTSLVRFRLPVWGVTLIMVGLNLRLLTQADGLFFVSSHGLTYKAQQETFAYVFETAPAKQPIRLVSLTRPYLHEEGWQFLAKQQNIPLDNGSAEIYVTIEPWVDSFWVDRWIADLGDTTIVESKHFGEITVEHRHKR